MLRKKRDSENPDLSSNPANVMRVCCSPHLIVFYVEWEKTGE